MGVMSKIRTLSALNVGRWV